MDQFKQDRIDQYILNRMSDAERVSFESDLLQDNELCDQFHYTKTVREAMLHRNEKIEKISRWRGRKQISVKTLWISGIVSTAAILFLVFGGISTRFNEGNIRGGGAVGSSAINLKLDESYYTTYRGDGNLKEVANLINEKKFQKALDRILVLEQELKKEETAANANTGLPAEEVEYGQQVRAIVSYELSWLKVYALIGLGRKAEAEELLQMISEKEGSHRLAADSLSRML